MNEAMPPWRTFSSEARSAAAPEAPSSDRRGISRWLAPGLAGLGGALAGIALAGAGLLAWAALPQTEGAVAFARPSGTDGALGIGEPAAVPAVLVVDVAGAVVRPGLHRLRTGDRVGDAIEAAGGFAPRADLTAASQSLNLAHPLEDGAKVLVPELGVDRVAARTAADDGRIDLNRAGRDELESLPGIGPVTSGKIVEAREDRRFETVRDLRTRGLVGEKVYEDIKGLVRTS